MPSLSSSVEVNGKYYCYDNKTGQLYEVEAKFIPVEIPPDIREVIKKIVDKSEESSR